MIKRKGGGQTMQLVHDLGQLELIPIDEVEQRKLGRGAGFAGLVDGPCEISRGQVDSGITATALGLAGKWGRRDRTSNF